MMRKLFFILFLFIGLACCNKKDKPFSTCEFSDPLEDLAWLKEFKETLTDCDIEISIFQAIYNNDIVYYTAITDPRVNSVFGITLWNCEGDIVRIFDYDEADKFHNLVTDRTVLYRCKSMNKSILTKRYSVQNKGQLL